MCAKKVVAGARCSSVLPGNRQQDAQQIASAQRFCQLEGLAVAIPWGFEETAPAVSYFNSSKTTCTFCSTLTGVGVA